MNEWYDASSGEFAQIKATRAAASASRPPTASERRMPVTNLVSPGVCSGRMRRTTDTWRPQTLDNDERPKACRTRFSALRGQASAGRDRPPGGPDAPL